MRDLPFHTPYPTYDVLEKRDSPSWDDVTRAVVDKRIDSVPPRRFFTEDEWRTLEAVVDRLMPQPDRGEAKIPIVPFIDEKLHENQGDGYRYASLPPQREAFRKAISGIQQDSLQRHGRAFVLLTAAEQDALLQCVARGEVQGEAWQGMDVKRFFNSSLMSQVVSVYYAHPAAWSEIGFGGPASPRGYVRHAANRTDPWEAPKARDGGDQP